MLNKGVDKVLFDDAGEYRDHLIHINISLLSNLSPSDHLPNSPSNFPAL